MKIRRVTLLAGSSVALVVTFGMFAGAASGGQIAGVSDPQLLGAGEVDRFLAGVGGELGSGCALLLARHGKVFCEKSSGGFDARKPVRIASATKWLSGAVIVSLVDEGRIKLDDLASRYLPGLTGEASRITVRQLLAHTSGLAMSHPALGERDITLKQAVDAIVTAPLMFPPGRACVYGDVSFQVAGRIAEIASGIDRPSGQLRESLFTSRLSIPLEMTGTSCEGLRPTDNPHLAGGATSTLVSWSTSARWTLTHRVDAYFDLLDDLRKILGTRVDLVMVDAVKNRYLAADIERTQQTFYAA